MPVNGDDDFPEFIHCLALISAVIENADTECVLVLGDFNAHPGTLFEKELMNYCGEESLRCIDMDKLNSDAYTFVSGANGACRWLDHCLVTEAAADLVTNVRVDYQVTASDHFPLVIDCNLNFIRPKITINLNENLDIKNRHIWGTREREQCIEYHNICDKELFDLINKYDDIICNMECMTTDILCKNESHYKCIDDFYNIIVETLQSAAVQSSEFKNSKKRNMTVGWNFHVRSAHAKAREMFSKWVLYGRPRSGYHYENMAASRRKFKAAIKYVRKNKDKIKMDVLARHHSDRNFIKFWKETKKLDCKSSLPVCVEGQKDKKGIANIFREHFEVKTQSTATCTSRPRDSETHHVVVTSEEIRTILKNMKRGKSPGHDGLSIEHLQYAGQHICHLLAKLFNFCVRHSYLPQALIRTLVVPITKNKTGDISSAANYRPISLATIMAKILERVICSHISSLSIDDAQFGFRPQVSTDMAIFSLKEIVKYYVKHDTTVYGCFLDLSRAFDTINHELLWEKMYDAKVPPEVVGLLTYWYGNQTNSVRWDFEFSDSYRLSCGVRQGGITSPDLFNLYVNDLIVELSSTPVGLKLDGRYVNNLSYADDMVLLSPSIKGLRKLITICERYALSHDLKYNVKKTEMMIFRSGGGPHNVPEVRLNGQPVKIVDNFRYLGHVVNSSLKDDGDIERQRRSLCAVGNMIARKFFKAASDVKITLLKSFCQNFYTCQLWTKYTKKSHDTIRVAYNNVFRHLMGLKWHCSASGMFTEARVDSFNAIQRKRIAMFMSRVGTCRNKIIKSLADRLPLTETYRRWLDIVT